MSTTIILRDFSFTRDFRKIQWGPTIWYNLLRAACTGLVVGLLVFVLPQSSGDRIMALAVPLVWPIFYLIVFLPIGIVFSLLQGLPYVGLFAAFLAVLAVGIGDPIVCLLYKLRPKIVPVDSPPLFSLYLIVWVLAVPEIVLAN